MRAQKKRITTQVSITNSLTLLIVIIKPFLSKKVPGITIKNYLERLVKYSKIENTTLVLILIYIDRVCDLNKIRLNYFNIHK